MIKKILLILIATKAFTTSAQCSKDTLINYLVQGDIDHKFTQSRQINKFTAYDSILSETVQVWDNNDWQNYSITEYTYDANKYNTVYLEKNWSNFTMSYENYSRILYIYTGNKKTSTTFQSWSTQDNDWLNKVKIINYSFAKSNIDSAVVRQSWINNDWVYTYKFLSTFNSGKLIQNDEYVWNKNTSDWDISTKKEYTYNGSNQLTELLYSGYNAGNWIIKTKHFYQYYPGGQLKEDLYQTNQMSQLTNAVKDSYEYTLAGKVSKYDYQLWVNKAWENNSETTYEYANNGDLSAVNNYYSWDKVNSKYAVWNRQEYNCAFAMSLKNIAKESTLKVYPNPFSTDQKLIVKLEKSENYTLYNSLGQVVQQGVFTEGENILSFKEEQSNGVYLLRTESGFYKLVCTK